MPFSNFGKFPNKVLIETGSYYGDGIQAALDSGFQDVYSIEITEKYYRHCSNRFRNNNKVHTVLGDTLIMLPGVIRNINVPITFWLDGHWDVGAIDETRGLQDFPICKELEIIAQHPIKNHTILIDDIRLLDAEWDVARKDVIDAIYKINKDYKISYEDGLAGRINDVLVATI